MVEDEFAAPTRRQPLSDVGNLKGDHAPTESRSSDLASSSPSCNKPAVACDDGQSNNDNYQPSDCDNYRKLHASNNRPSPSGLASSRLNGNQIQCQASASGDDLQTLRASPTSAIMSKSRRTSGQAELKNETITATTTTGIKQTGNVNRSDERSTPGRQSASEPDAEPKSVRSLISRFNMI